MFSAAFPRSPRRFDGGSLVPWERTGRLYVLGMVLHGCARAFQLFDFGFSRSH